MACTESGKTPLILIVDDYEDLRESFACLVRCEGYRVTTASNGAEALAVVAQHEPALVLLDIHMPGMDGFAVLAALRPDERGLRVVMMTAVGEQHHRVQAAALGACDYFVKGSFELDHLLHCIARHVAA